MHQDEVAKNIEQQHIAPKTHHLVRTTFLWNRYQTFKANENKSEFAFASKIFLSRFFGDLLHKKKYIFIASDSFH
jgi:hypothetical protein